jgi:predicted O-methyltransferase YrrM
MIEHFCDKIQGWFAYPNIYAEMVDKAREPRKYIFVEVGSWKGKSTAFMATEIINSKRDIQFYAVDTWKGSEEHYDISNSVYEPLLKDDKLYDEFLKNTIPVHKAIFPIRMESARAATLFADESIDFVMIDAAHDYDNVLLDIKSWYPKIRRGGIIAGDDVDWEGTKRAVGEYFTGGYYESDNKLWMAIKP